MCFKTQCLKCKNYFHKDVMYYYKGYNKYNKTYLCHNCLRKHYRQQIGSKYIFYKN